MSIRGPQRYDRGFVKACVEPDRAMKLSQLLDALMTKTIMGDGDPDITAVTADSRRVTPGALFVAVTGSNVDGHAFIGDALRRGARAVVGEKQPAADRMSALPLVLPVPYVMVPDTRSALAHLSAAWHGFPARRLRVIGVTGTDGKTTTATCVRSILEAAGLRAGLVSTVAASIGSSEIDTGFHTTTPEAPELQEYLGRMVAEGCAYAVVETTSHALHQKRVDACEYDVAVITNITHEHLDYHGSFEQYRDAKAMLFRLLSTAVRKPGLPKIAVLNADDASYAYLRAIPADVHLSYGLAAPADVTARDVRLHEVGAEFVAVTPEGALPITIPFPGRYNVANALAAIAVAVGLGLPHEAIQRGLAAVPPVKGRMERIEEGQDFMAIVDFAHTPNALEQALLVARGMARGRVIVVFGCAGLRDRQKRPLMGAVAGRLADFTVITAEDPRTESLSKIMQQIAAGLKQVGRHEGRDYVRIADRALAIAFAVDMARAGDLVIVTGKGHEQSLCFGSIEYPWSDHAALRAALARAAHRSMRSVYDTAA